MKCSQAEEIPPKTEGLAGLGDPQSVQPRNARYNNYYSNMIPGARVCKQALLMQRNHHIVVFSHDCSVHI